MNKRPCYSIRKQQPFTYHKTILTSSFSLATLIIASSKLVSPYKGLWFMTIKENLIRDELSPCLNAKGSKGQGAHMV